MIGAVYKGESQLHLEEIPLREIQPDEILLKIDSATICGTDIHILEGNFEVKPPVVLGHEFSGYVEKKGSNVSNCNEGDLVTVEPHIYCGECKPCRMGRPNLCLDRLAWGINLDGGFAEYTIVRKDIVYPVPNNISPEVAALSENIGCCLNGIQRAKVKIGDTVVILGGGSASFIISELAQLSGASTIIVSEPSNKRREFFRKHGMITVNPLEENIKDVVNHYTEGNGADVVIEGAGRKETAEQSVQLVGPGGTILFFGVVPPLDLIQLEPNYIYAKEISIVGSVRNPFTHHQVMQILPRLNLQEIITHQFDLQDIHKAVDFARKGTGFKICIKPHGVKENE